MTLQLALSAELEQRLQTAAVQHGKCPEEYAMLLLEENLPADSSNAAGAEMLLVWAQEADEISDEESKENEGILHAIDEVRTSDRQLFDTLGEGKHS